jgi:hypothetical protein
MEEERVEKAERGEGMGKSTREIESRNVVMIVLAGSAIGRG